MKKEAIWTIICMFAIAVLACYCNAILDKPTYEPPTTYNEYFKQKGIR